MDIDNAAEAIINELKAKEGYADYKDLAVYQQIGKTQIGYILTKLEVFNLIESRGDSSRIKLSNKGWEFDSFDKIRQELQMQLALIKASKEAAESTISVNKNQWSWNLSTLSVAIAAVIISLLLLIKDWSKPDIIDKDTKEILRTQSIILDSLRQSIENLQNIRNLQNGDTLKVVHVKN